MDDPTMPVAVNAGTTTLEFAGVGFFMPSGHALAPEIGTTDFAFTASGEPGAFSVGVSVKYVSS